MMLFSICPIRVPEKRLNLTEVFSLLAVNNPAPRDDHNMLEIFLS
jgi:hypothetical protein